MLREVISGVRVRGGEPLLPLSVRRFRLVTISSEPFPLNDDFWVKNPHSDEIVLIVHPDLKPCAAVDPIGYRQLPAVGLHDSPNDCQPKPGATTC